MSDGEALVCRIARGPRERASYFGLRREIFCAEQGLFAGDDADAIDAQAHPIVCLLEGTVVGVVRIWEDPAGSGCWWGGRLGVARAHRTLARVGRRLVQQAVGTARAWGALRFQATVQRGNVAFFRRLHWRSLEELTLLGQPHHLMAADLERYPPTSEPRLPAGALDEAA